MCAGVRRASCAPNCPSGNGSQRTGSEGTGNGSGTSPSRVRPSPPRLRGFSRALAKPFDPRSGTASLPCQLEAAGDGRSPGNGDPYRMQRDDQASAFSAAYLHRLAALHSTRLRPSPRFVAHPTDPRPGHLRWSRRPRPVASPGPEGPGRLGGYLTDEGTSAMPSEDVRHQNCRTGARSALVVSALVWKLPSPGEHPALDPHQRLPARKPSLSREDCRREPPGGCARACRPHPRSRPARRAFFGSARRDLGLLRRPVEITCNVYPHPRRSNRKVSKESSRKLVGVVGSTCFHRQSPTDRAAPGTDGYCVVGEPRRALLVRRVPEPFIG